MKAGKVALGLGGALVVAGAAGWFSLDKETRGLLATLPTNRDVLFWSQPQRDAAFRALDRLSVLAKSRVVPAGGTTLPLPPGAPLKLPLDVDAYMAGQRSAALLVVHDGWRSFGIYEQLPRDRVFRSVDEAIRRLSPTP